MKVTDVARAVDKNAEHEIVGIRPGEKLHEQMISPEDSHYTYEYNDYYKILPCINNWSSDENRINKGKLVPEGFTYSSDNNSEWMSIEELTTWIDSNRNKIGKI